MAGNIALFAAGLLMLWASSEVIIRNITPLARILGVKELVVTVLGVSILSSLPELTVSAFAIAAGNSDVSVGNVIGSNFVTLTFVTAVCALIRPIDIHRDVQERESSWMILSSALVLILSMDGILSRSDGCILMLTYLPYIHSVLSTAHEGVERSAHDGRPVWRKLVKPAGFTLVGILGLIFSSKLSLDSGEKLGQAAGIPALPLGVVLFAFGTSLPELAISMSATLKRKADVTIGEVYASNIFTQMVVLGICCLISPITVAPSMLSFAMPLLVLATVVIQLFVTSGLRVTRREAIGLLIFYAVFVVNQFLDLPSLSEMLGF